MNRFFEQLQGSNLSPFDILLLVLYASTSLGIGLYASKRKSDSDFMIAGRKIGIIGFVTSVVASYIGGAALVAYSAYVYRFGMSAFAVFIGTAIGFLVFIPYGIKLRKFSGEKQFYTLSDWFYFKFNKPVGLFSAIILLIVYSGMLLNQFIAGSSLLAHISGWSYETGLLMSAALIMTYLLAGGFRSVIRTDIFQYFVLLVIIIMIASVIFQDDKKDFTLELVDFSRMNIGMTIAFTGFGIFIIFQSAEYWQRVYGARSDRIVRDGFILSAIFTVITGIAITIVGLAAHSHLPGIEAKDAFAKGLTLLLPRKLLGASLIMIFAAIMSAADTQIFVLASSVAVDWYDKLSGKKSDDKRRMQITRIGIISVSFLSCLGAFFLRDLVAVIIFITGIGFTIIPASVASFHWKISSRAALASFASGIAYIFILIAIAMFQQNPMEFFKDKADLAILSIVVSAVTLVIVNIFTNNKA
ncbi:MAG: sodium:solute symporter family protein [Bacteroidota bacterium]|jgi:Na+/proline symporter